MARIIPLILGFLFLIPSILLNIYFLKNQNQPQQFKVLRVIDGDTFETTDHRIIRLLGIEAPELSDCGGQQAKTELEHLISDQKIYYYSPTVDVYNRQIADVYLSNKISVNVAMIKTGWAAYDSSQSIDKTAAKQAGEDSRTSKKGIYSSQCNQYTNPSNSKCLVKGNFDPDRQTKIYFIQGCTGYDSLAINLAQKDQWFCSEAEAVKAGFVKSETCHDKKF